MMPRTDWTRDLKPDQAQAALTVREAVELQKLKLPLQAKAEGR